MMNRIESSKLLFYLNKYFFLYLLVLFIISLLETGVLHTPVSKSEMFMLLSFTILHFITYRRICMAKVDKEGVQLTAKLFVRWEQIKSISFIPLFNLYCLRVKATRGLYLFPSSIFPMKMLGYNIEYSRMDQIIQMMKEKHNL